MGLESERFALAFTPSRTSPLVSFLYAKPGGLTSGACDTPQTAGTLKYVMETASLWTGKSICVVMRGPNNEAHQIDFSARILADFPTGTASQWKQFVAGNGAGVVVPEYTEIEAVGTWSSQYTMIVLKGTHEFVAFKWLKIKGSDKSYNLVNNSNSSQGTTSQSNTTTSSWTITFDDCWLEKSVHHALSFYGGPDSAPSAAGLVTSRCTFFACGIVAAGAGIVGRPLTGLTPRVNVTVRDCFFNGCDVGLFFNYSGVSADLTITGSVFYNQKTTCLTSIGNNTGTVLIENNVFIGDPATCGALGFSGGTANTNMRVRRNVFADLNYGISDAGVDVTSPPATPIYAENLFSTNMADFLDVSAEAVTPLGAGNLVGVDPQLKSRTPSVRADARFLRTSPANVLGWKGAGTYGQGTLRLGGVLLNNYPLF